MWTLQQGRDLEAETGCGKRLRLHAEVGVNKLKQLNLQISCHFKTWYQERLKVRCEVVKIDPVRCRAWTTGEKNRAAKVELWTQNSMWNKTKRSSGRSISTSAAGHPEVCWGRDGGWTERAERKKMEMLEMTSWATNDVAVSSGRDTGVLTHITMQSLLQGQHARQQNKCLAVANESLQTYNIHFTQKPLYETYFRERVSTYSPKVKVAKRGYRHWNILLEKLR